MARVLFCACSNVTWTKENYMDGFAEGFIRTLVRMGHNILSINTRKTNVFPFANELRVNVDGSNIRKTICDFAPELIITFNNSMPGDVLEYTDCPVLVYSADVPSLYSDKEKILKNLDRYYFANGARYIEDAIREIFSPDERHIYFFGHATDLKRIDREKTRDIVYVGSMPNHSQQIISFWNKLNNLYPAEKMNEIKAEFFEEYYRIQEEQFVGDLKFDVNNYIADFQWQRKNVDLLCLESTRNKFKLLSSMTDFDLEIHGYPGSWPLVMQYDYKLFQCFDYELSVTLDQNANTYAKARIGLNVPNATSKEGLSWRVTDILASSAVLLTRESPVLKELFKGYVDFPMYTDADSAHVLARKLLADDCWRNELIEISNAMINDKCRFEPKIKEIFQMIGISDESCSDAMQNSIGRINDLPTC